MQIVIDIPSEMYDWFENGFPDEDDTEKSWQIVKNGTPLVEHCDSCIYMPIESEDE